MKNIAPSLIAALSLLLAATGSAVAGPGGWDQTYGPTVSSGAVYAMALQPNGELVVGGAFTAVDSSSARDHLGRLFSDGSLDTTFFNTGSGVSSTVWSLAVETDGRIVIGGDFTSINGTSRTRLARLNANGTVDGSFLPTNTINSSVLALAVQTNNAVVIGGAFNGGTFPSWNARLNADGTTDTNFSSLLNGAVYAIAIQTDGKIVIGGAFTTVNGTTRNRIARLLSNGSVDTTFQNGLTGASGIVRCAQIQTDGKILIGGDFTAVNGTARGYVARLNTDGSLDTAFNSSPGANNSVYALAVQPDNKVVMGGNFTSYASVSLTRVARLYADGTRDTTFTNFGINSTVESLALQSDGGLLLGGLFTTINNTNRQYLGRLYGDLYPPEFVVEPASRGTNVGATVTFTAQVSNPTATSFQWLFNGTNLSGATGTAYSLYNVQFSDAGNYSVFVSDALGGTSSSNALLQVGIAPVFTSQAGSLSVTQGQTASFSVTATGTPLNYFWRKNGTFSPGQTNSSLSFTNVLATDAATYTCQVSNFLGSITSTGAVLTVAFPPTISVQPVGLTVGVGSNFTVSVTAGGYPALAFQWRTNGTGITGATNASYAVAGAQTNNSADYDVVIANSIGSITSSVATISVVYYVPTIGLQPVGGNVLVGSNFTLSVSATGTAPLNWQWRTNGAPLAGANASSYAITSAQFTDAGAYDVVVTNLVGGVTSSVALVRVGYAPVVVQPPLSLTNSVGGTANFSCLVTGTVPISLQWTLNGYPIGTQTNLGLTLTNLQSTNIGFYALTATNSFGGAVSSDAALQLNGFNFSQWAGLVAYYPLDGDATDASGNGNNGTNNGALGAGDRFGNTNGALLFNGNGNYIQCKTGAYFGSRYTITAWVNATAYNYYSRILDFGNGAAVDNTDLAFSQANTGQPYFEVYSGTTRLGDCQASSALPLNTWVQVIGLCDGTQISLFTNGVMMASSPATVNRPPIITSLNYLGRSNWRLTGGDQDFAGSFDDIRILNRALSANEVAQLYALEADMPVITRQPQAQTVPVGGTVSFSVTVTANHPLTYQWRTNDVPLAGATNSVLTLSNVQSANIGFYSVAVSNSVTGVVSVGALLNLTGAVDPTKEGLVAYYPFNGNVEDASGNGYDGTNYGVLMGTNRFGAASAAGQFDGTSSHVILPSALVNLMSGTNPMSVSAWVAASPIVTNTGNKDILDLGAASPNGVFALLMLSGNLFYSEWGGTYNLSSGIPIGDGSWHHCVASYDGVNVSLYVDGGFASARAAFANRLNTIGTIGVRADLTAEFWNGGIDDVRIYNRALSADEVAYLYGLESQSPLPAPLILTASLGAGPNFNLHLAGGLPGGNYILQTVTNLAPPIRWQSLSTNTADTNGVSQFSDTNLNSAQKFYRLTTP